MIERQEILPGLSDREIFESMSPQSLLDHILHLGDKATEIENKMNLASEVLEGAYGLTVEQMLTDNATLPEGGNEQNE